MRNLPVATRRQPAAVPKFDERQPMPRGTRDLLKELGPEKFCEWVRQQKSLLLTDTTMRDAHQSLLATRLRTYDMLQVAEAYARLAPQFFSLEMWGGATFDTSMRFLKESPWTRLTDMRQRIPTFCSRCYCEPATPSAHQLPRQCRAGVCAEAAEAGIDVFRVFDAPTG